MKVPEGERGETLIEILVPVVILLALASIAIPTFMTVGKIGKACAEASPGDVVIVGEKEYTCPEETPE